MRRVAFFDIDGTLLTGGPAKDAFCEAMIDTYGTMGNAEAVSFGGKTDPQIARELLLGIGYHLERIEEQFPLLWQSYTERLEDKLTRRPVQVCTRLACPQGAVGVAEPSLQSAAGLRPAQVHHAAA